MCGIKGMKQRILRGTSALNTKENNFYKYLKVPDNEHGCLEWVGSKHAFGYGVFKTRILAHRFSYQHFIGKIGDGLSVLHKCDNPSCVHPDHLFLGTQEDNLKDMTDKKRGRYPGSPGERNHKHKLTETDVGEIKSRLQMGDKQKNIAKKYSIHPSQVSRINTNTTWRNI